MSEKEAEEPPRSRPSRARWRFDAPQIARGVEWLLLVASIGFFVLFLMEQTEGITNPWILEWDTRATSLPAWRFHGTGLFPNDLIVDYMGAFYATPGWSVLFWIGTLFTDPLTVTKVLPLLALAVVVWQGGAFGLRRFGPAGAAVCIFLLVSSYYIWFRLLGFNSRAFGFPFLCSFVRYVDAKAEKRTLATLLLASLCYPSVLLLMGPTYGLVLLARRESFAVWKRLTITGLVCLGIMSRQMLFPDPRIGKPPTMEQAATLRQMGPGSNQPFYPLPSVRSFLEPVVRGPFDQAGQRFWKKTNKKLRKHPLTIPLAVGGGLGLLAWRRMKSFPVVLPAALVAALVMYVVIAALAYRLYLPDRPLTFAWPVAVALGFPVLAHEAFSRVTKTWAPTIAAVLVAGFFLVLRGDGRVPPHVSMPYGAGQNTPALQFCKTLPKDALIIALPERSSAIQAYAQRSTLFSMHSNTPFFYEFAREMERRFEEFYRAYYASSWEPLKKLHRERGVTHVVMDTRDFGPLAQQRGSYAEPWNSILSEMIASQDPPFDPVLRQPPEEAVEFSVVREHTVELAKLPETAAEFPLTQ
jgi:hypothetical protein